MKIISCINHKGGVGKTTTTLNLGAGLSRNNRKTLIIDIDPQANLTQSVGLVEQKQNIYEALKGNQHLPEIEITENLFITPSTLDLSSAELELSMEPGRESLLKILLNKLNNVYDFILIDCPPSLGLLTINALNTSDGVLIPLQAQFLASKGLHRLLEVVQKVKSRLNPKLEIAGIVITMFKKRTILSRDILEFSNKQFSDWLFSTKIHENISLAEAPAVGKDIFTYCPKSSGAKDYSELTIEFINRVSQF